MVSLTILEWFRVGLLDILFGIGHLLFYYAIVVKERPIALTSLIVRLMYLFHLKQLNDRFHGGLCNSIYVTNGIEMGSLVLQAYIHQFLSLYVDQLINLFHCFNDLLSSDIYQL